MLIGRLLLALKYKTILRLFIKVLGLIKLIIFARLLGPIGLGVFGASSLLMNFFETFTDMGVYVLLMQERNGLKRIINQAFTISILRGFIVSSLIFISVPFSEVFFNSVDVKRVLLLLSIIPFLKGFINPAIIKYEKYLNFDKEFKLRAFLILIDSMFSIIFVYFFKAPEGIVMGLIISAVFELLFSWVFISPKPKIELNIGKLRMIIKEGKWITLNGILNYLYHNIDDIFVSKFLGLNDLGIYQTSYKISTIVIYETGEIFGRVSLPIYSKVSSDYTKLKNVFIKILLYITIISLLLGGTLFLFASSIVIIFLGQEWLIIVPLIKILIFFGMIKSITGSVTPFFYSIKKQKEIMKVMLIGLVLLVILIYPLIRIFGLYGAAFSTLFSVIFTIPFIYVYLKKYLFF